MSLLHLSLSGLLALAMFGCNSVSTVRVGATAPSRPLDCPLDLQSHDAAQGMPKGLELLGYVRVIHEEGKAPDDPEVLQMVKPEACKLGGEIVTPAMSSNFDNGFRTGSSLSYAVWRHAPAPGTPRTSQRF